MMSNADSQGYAPAIRRSLVLLFRMLQWTLALLGVVFVVGGFRMEANGIELVVLSIIALVLVAWVGVLEWLAVRPLKEANDDE